MDVPKAQFTDTEVQDILSKITGLDLEKVFRPLREQLTPPKYKLMTDPQLQEVRFFVRFGIHDGMKFMT